MEFSIDLAIVVVFLLINLFFGLSHSRQISTIKDYAIANNKITSMPLIATIIATAIGGGFFSSAVSESYSDGLYFIIPALGEPIALIFVGMVIAPRMAEFIGDLSIADAMGRIFGERARIMTAIFAITLCVGMVAIQFHVASSILGVFFNFSGIYAVAVSAVIVTFYSSMGGIRAVTFTDVIQFLTFATVIPIISSIIFDSFGSSEAVLSSISSNPDYNFFEVMNVNNPKFGHTMLLMFFFFFPSFQPVFFQRISMARNTQQAKRAFSIAGVVIAAILLVTSLIGTLVFVQNPDLESNQLLSHIITHHSYVGLKGLTCVAIMAVVMSTADSYINSAAVMLTSDIVKPLKIKSIEGSGDIQVLRWISVAIGASAFFLAFYSDTILQLLQLVLSFYAPVVTMPITLAVFGFRSSEKTVLVAMFSGIITTIVWKAVIENYIDFGSYIPAILANTIALFAYHYLFNQPGGWVGSSNHKQSYSEEDDSLSEGDLGEDKKKIWAS